MDPKVKLVSLMVLVFSLPSVADAPPPNTSGPRDVFLHVRTYVDGEIVEDDLVTDEAYWAEIDYETMTSQDGERYSVIFEVVHPNDATLQLVTRLVRDQRGDSRARTGSIERVGSPHRPPRVGTGIEQWMVDAQPSDTRLVEVRLRSETTAGLPPSLRHLLDVEPAFVIDHEIARLEAREQARAEAHTLREPLMAAVEQAGGTALNEYVGINCFKALITPAALESLLEQEELLHISDPMYPEPDEHDGQHVQWVTQAQQYHDDGSDGSQPSGDAFQWGTSTEHDRLVIGIIDNQIDADHPVFQDDSGGTDRVVEFHRFNGASWSVAGESSAASDYSSGVADPNHGTKVAYFAAGDLEDGQDAGVSNVRTQQGRTGQAPEAKLVFISTKQATMLDTIDRAYDIFPDIVNHSQSAKPNPICDEPTSGAFTANTVDAVNLAMNEGIFWTQTPGNEGHSGTACTTATPGTAAGAFVVNPALVNGASPLFSQDTTTDSSRGDNHPSGNGTTGSSLISLVAPGGRKDNSCVQFNDGYTDCNPAASWAAPIVAGAVGLLEDWLYRNSFAVAGNPRHEFPLMLLMSDNRNESLGVNDFDPLDSQWGAGYLRMRLFTVGGMDAPARAAWGMSAVANGETVEIDINPSGGVNIALSSNVKHIRAATWWHEPTLEAGNSDLAQIDVSCAPTVLL
jgi:hypothetical protein